MKPIDAGQASLLAAPQLSLVTLCKLVTYSDRAAGTVQATRYFSDGARRYDWANEGTVRQFEPWLLSMEPARDTMNHLPSMDGGGLESALRRRRGITLRNWLPETASYLYATLRAENLEGARIEIAQLAIDRGAGASFEDLTGFAGSEQTCTFRGVVASVSRVDEQEIELALAAELPSIPWIYAHDSALNDPADLGKRIPIVVGSAKHVPAIGWRVGSVTTLAAVADALATTLALTDASLFASSATNGARVGSQLISWTGKTGNQLTGVTGLYRAQTAGQLVVELVSSATWIVSGKPVSAIGDVYAADPFTGALVRVTTAHTKTVADSLTIPGATVASISMSSGNIQGLLDAMAQVGQQPSTEDLPTETRRPTLVSSMTSGDHCRDGNLGSAETSSVGVLFTWPTVPGRSIVEVTYEVYATIANGDTLDFRWPTGTTTPAVHTISNDSGSARTDWWRWTTSDPDYIGTSMGVLCNDVFQVQRIERYSSGPTRLSETRRPARQVGSALSASNFAKVIDGNTAWTGVTSPATAGYQWDAVEGRSLVEVVYRAYVSLQDGDSVFFRETSGGSNVFQSSNEMGATVEGWFEFATDDPDQMGTDIYCGVTSGSTLREVERIELWEAVVRDVEIKSAKVGLGLRLFADVDGPRVPYDYDLGYSWDDSSGWSSTGGTLSTETTTKTEGSASQKFVGSPSAPTVITTCDNDRTNWGQHRTDNANEASITVGGGSLRIESTELDNGDSRRYFPSTLDFTSMRLRLYLFVPSGHVLDATDGIRIRLTTTTNVWKRWHFGSDDLEFDVWNVIEIDPSTGWDSNSSGTWNVAILDRVTVELNWQTTPVIGNVLYVDQIERVATAPAVVQRNATSGTLDLTATDSTYQVDVRADGITEGDTLIIYFSNVAGSGTTKPASYWTLEISASELTSGAFVTVEKAAIGVGSPATPNNVETVGFELQGSKGGTYYVDNLRVRSASSSSPYIAAAGDVIEKMPDVLRYLLTEVCALGAAEIDSGWNAIGGASYLDDNAHAVDLAALGEDFRDVLAALAYEGRCSVVADERASATTWRLAAALSTYAWPSASTTLTKWQELTEEGRAPDAIRTRFRHLYQWRPELGDGIEAFAAAIQTTVTAAETKVGRHDADAVGLRTIETTATASEIAGYYEQERSRIAATWSIRGVPWIDGYALERGDVLAFTPPWATAKKARVIETQSRTDGLVDLRVVEVP